MPYYDMDCEWSADTELMIPVTNLWLLRGLSEEPSTRVLRSSQDVQKPHQNPEKAIFRRQLQQFQ